MSSTGSPSLSGGWWGRWGGYFLIFHEFSLFFMKFQKKSKEGRGGGGLTTCNFPRYWRRLCKNSRGQLKKVEFPGVIKKKFMWNFCGSWFLILEFPRGVAQFCRISRYESFLSLGFLMGKWQIWKIQGGMGAGGKGGGSENWKVSVYVRKDFNFLLSIFILANDIFWNNIVLWRGFKSGRLKPLKNLSNVLAQAS